MQVYDTHCHIGLDGKVAPEDDHSRAVAASVGALLVVGIDAPTSQAAKELSRLPGVRWSSGLHPNDSTKFAEQWPIIEALAREPTCTAIGETGLDCFRDRTPLDQQERSLRAHLALAREIDKPVIAAVNGAAYGGGCETALICDFIYASSTARFALTEITLGIIPGAMGTQNLPNAVGERRAKEIIFTGRPFSQRVLISSAIGTPLDSVVFLWAINHLSVSGVVAMTASKMLGALIVWRMMRRREAAQA